MTFVGNGARRATASIRSRNSWLRPARKIAWASLIWSPRSTISSKMRGMLPPPAQPALMKTVNFSGSSPSSARVALVRLGLILKFRMDRYAADFDLLVGHAVIDQLSPRVFGGDQIKADFFAGPAAPEPVTRVGHYRNERDAVEQAELAQHAPQKMLRHRVNRDDDLRTVFLEQLPHVPRSHSIEQARFVRAEMFDRPVVILHQVLGDGAAGSCKTPSVFRPACENPRSRGLC